MSARDGGGKTGGSCDVAWVREVRRLRREAAVMACVLAVLAAAVLAAGAAAVAIAGAPPPVVYDAR